MKKAQIILLMLISFSLFGRPSNAQEATKVKTDTVKYWVSMSCEDCVAKIEKNIAFEKGVKDLVVDLKTKTVTIAYKNKKTKPEKLEKAIQELGFKSEKIEPVPEKSDGREK